MIYHIDEKKVHKYGLTVPETLIIMLVKAGVDLQSQVDAMVEKQLLHREGNTLMVTRPWDDKAMHAVLDAEPEMPESDRIDKLAQSLMEIFPQGKMPGTPYYYKGNRKDVALKLKKFFKLYGESFTDEQILNATKAYVSSFNGNYKGMRLLKYFIWKDVKKTDSEGKAFIEEVSDLADYITNAGSTERNDDWTVSLL